MLKLKIGIFNGVYLSLLENSTNAFDNYYLIVFTNLQTRVSEGRVAIKSTVNDRSVLLYFYVNIAANPNFTMQENSFFKYDVYEQTSSTNTDITNASVLGLRETGKAWVSGTSEVVYVKEPEANIINSVYLKS